MNETAKNEIATTEERSVALTSPNPMQVLSAAIEKGVSTDQLTALMDLQERYEAREAKKAFVRAMSEFKKGCPEIYKNAKVSYGEGAKKTEYNHATLDHIVETVCPVMSKFGLSHTWETEQLDGGQIRVTCIVTHDEGHSEKTTLQSGRDDSGGKNNIQAVGSTLTYLQRYTFLSATGLAARNMDDDGNAIPSMRITSDQADELTDLLMSKGGVTAVNFVKDKFKVDSLSMLPEARFNDAMRAARAMKGMQQ